jgi:hypothetical protein
MLAFLLAKLVGTLWTQRSNWAAWLYITNVSFGFFDGIVDVLVFMIRHEICQFRAVVNRIRQWVNGPKARTKKTALRVATNISACTPTCLSRRKTD